MTRSAHKRPLILLVGLDPIFHVGMERALVDGGAAVIEDAHPSPDALVRRVAESGPDAIVLGGSPSRGSDLCARLRAAAPGATLVLWRADARSVAVLAPGASAPRVMPAPSAGDLSAELFGRTGKGETCPST